MSSSTALPAYSASLQQASPYYAAGSYVPSPLGSTYSPSPPPQQLIYAHSPAQRPLLPSPPTAPLHQELGIAPSRADEVFIARQYEATERRIACAVPDGLARAGRGRHNQEEDAGATVYTVGEEHLINMRQALAGVPMLIVSIATISEPSTAIATVDGVLAATSYPLSDPTQAPNDTIPVLDKIEEAKEPSEGESEDESDTLASDEHEQDVSTPDRDTTPGLSSGSGSTASQDTFPSAVSDNGLGIDGWSPSSAKLDNGKWEPNWKIPVPLGTLLWMDELKGCGEDTVDLLMRIGSDQRTVL